MIINIVFAVLVGFVLGLLVDRVIVDREEAFRKKAELLVRQTKRKM